MKEKPLFELPNLLTLSGVDVQSVASIDVLAENGASCTDGGGCSSGGGCKRGGPAPIEE